MPAAVNFPAARLLDIAMYWCRTLRRSKMQIFRYARRQGTEIPGIFAWTAVKQGKRLFFLGVLRLAYAVYSSP